MVTLILVGMLLVGEGKQVYTVEMTTKFPTMDACEARAPQTAQAWDQVVQAAGVPIEHKSKCVQENPA